MLIDFLLLGAVVSTALFYRYVTGNNKFFIQRGIPHLRPAFLLGNTGRFVFRKQRPNEFLDQMYNALPANK